MPDVSNLDEPREELALNLSRASGELIAAIAKAQENVRTVGKDGWNKHSGYKYSTADDMIAAGRRARAGTGLAVLTTWTHEDIPRGKDSGKQWPSAKLTLYWVLGHSSGGLISGTITMTAIASGLVPPNKALAAAATYVEGFLERGLMRIDRDDVAEEDVDRRQPPARQTTHRRDQPSAVGTVSAPETPPQQLKDVRTIDQLKQWLETHGQNAVDARGPEIVEEHAMRKAGRVGASKEDVMRWLHGEMDAA